MSHLFSTDESRQRPLSKEMNWVHSLVALVNSTGYGSGFGDPNAKEQHEREIDLLKFKIPRRDNLKLTVVSALIGAVVAAGMTLFT